MVLGARRSPRYRWGVTPELEEALRRVETVRFLCTANAVRSTFAELFARHLGCPLPVDSAATVYQSPELFPETRLALLERGVDAALLADFEPRRLDRLVDDEAQVERLVLGMSPEHLEAYRESFPATRHAFLLTALLDRAEAVADPVLEGASFEDAFEVIATAVAELVQALRAGCWNGRRGALE